MPWYYAGPDAKPVGPIALEELQARFVSGVVSPETYVIEYTGQPSDLGAWKRYRELFPAIATPPALPAATPPVFTPPLPSSPPVQPHPLFPSAAFPASDPHLRPSSMSRTNPWCSWGFGLALTSLILLLPSCGLTAFIALPALLVCCVGLFQVQHNHAQTGRNLALSGLFLSGAALLITVVVVAIAIPAVLKGHGQITTTEQSTNDSQ